MILNQEKLAPFPNLTLVVQAQLKSWPDHANFLAARFNDEDEAALRASESVSKLVLSLTGEHLPRYCDDYQWMCEKFLEEELFFRRNKRYRRQSFADAHREIYSDKSYMSRYVNGILLSQLFWHNHAAALDLFRSRFLISLPEGYRHLEVGPGHGLFLSRAAADPRCGTATAWDVSESSIQETRAALDKLGLTRPVTLVMQDILQAPLQSRQFDSVIISEVLEHLEKPEVALGNLFESLDTGGRIFVNVPINSPAPDHIYLWTHPEQIRKLVTDACFAIDEMHLLPITGYSVDRALLMDAGISCVVMAHRP
jgi:2-polyprenyl-3-methyl-5-hydroxy-6-metoxy-1,4-benzoquinol methylase